MNAAATEVRPLQLSALVLSATEAQIERRARFDQAALKELAKSLTTTGQINPITVRPHPRDVRKFEIVAGERRYLAAGLAGLSEILCSVRSLTDEQVLEVQIIENLQREDLHELAEAEAYEKLVQMGRTPRQIAEQLHKDESYVRKRMRLLSLGKKARKAFYDDKIPASVAILIARIPVPKIQEEVLEYYLEETKFGAPTAESLRGTIEREYMTRLDQAPFDVADPNLVKVAGACGNCPKNTACQGALFDDVKGKAYCTDTPCYKAKVEANSARLLDKARASGRQVITGAAAKKIARYGSPNNLEGYANVAGHAWGHPVKKLLPEDCVPQLLQLPDSGQVIEVVPLKDLKKPAGERKDEAAAEKYRAQQRAKEQANKLEAEYRRRVLVALHEKPLSNEQEWLREGVLGFWRVLDAETKQALGKALGWETKGKGTGRSYVRHFDLQPFLPKDVSGLWKMLRLLCVAGDLQVHSWGGSGPKRLVAAAQAAKVDVKKIRAELVAERKAKGKAKAKKGKR